MALGPVQLLLVGFGPDAKFTGTALDELHRLREPTSCAWSTCSIVAKDDEGNVTKVEIADQPGAAGVRRRGRRPAGLGRRR